MNNEYKSKYEVEGQAANAVGSIVVLISGIGVSVLVLIFVGTLGGSTYQLVESDIDAITNTTVKDHVKASIISGFEALETTGNYMPIIVLAVIISLVLSLVLGMAVFGGAGGRSAL